MVYFVIFFVLILVCTTLYFRYQYQREKTKISFKESINLTELPIITVENKVLGKLNLLLDTGSNSSILTLSKAKDLNTTLTRNQGNDTLGGGGAVANYGMTMLGMSINDSYIMEKFLINDLDAVFSEIKSSYGVEVHGILGNSFFTNNKCNIDFEKLAFYVK